jgi:hypothetical protein
MLNNFFIILPCQTSPFNRHNFFTGMRRVAPDIAEPDSRNFPAEPCRKDLGVQPVPDVGRFDVGRKVLDKEAGLDDEADLRRVDVALTAGGIRTDGVRFFPEPVANVIKMYDYTVGLFLYNRTFIFL